MIWQRSVVAKEKVRTIVDYDSTQNTLLVGGRANNGSNASLANFNSTNSSGNVTANVSLRYFFLFSF